jgi:hypothetical protein
MPPTFSAGMRLISCRSYYYCYCHRRRHHSRNARHWPGQKVARSEAYATTFSLLSFSLRAEFLVIDGASLVILGSKRKTEDVDFAVTAAALFASEEGTQHELSHKGIGTSSELYLT